MKKRGMLLICTLAIMVILSIFLMTAVQQTQSNTMVTKRIIWDIKSFWSAEAGSTIAANGCILTKKFPNDFLSNNSEKNFGGYKVKRNSNSITGEDESSASSFNIYYNNHLNSSSLISNTTHLEASYKPHFYDINENIPQGEIYCLTVGKSGPAVCGVEFIYGTDDILNTLGTNVDKDNINKAQATTIAPAIYVGGNLIANIQDHFSVLQKNGSRGSILVGDTVDISSTKNHSKPSWYESGGFNIGEGTIFAKGVTINGNTIKIKTENNKYSEEDNSNAYLRDYGISIYDPPNEPIKIPDFEYLDTITCPSGSFVFLEMPLENELQYEEFNSICSSVMDVYLNPKQFLDYNKKSEENISEMDQTLNQLNKYIPENSYITNYNYKEIFNKIFDHYMNEVWNFNTIDSHDKALYKIHIAKKINNIIKSYCNKDNNNHRYENFFIPDGNFGITSSFALKGIKEENKIKYSDILKARIYGHIIEEIKNKESNDIKNALINNINNIKENGCHKVTLYKTNDIDIKITNEKEIYITEKMQDSSKKDFFIISKLKDHNTGQTENADYPYDSIEGKIQEVLKNIKFISNDNELSMEINCNLKSEGFFNFGTFDREDRLVDGGCKNSYDIGNFERYTRSYNRRASIKLGNIQNENSYYNNSIIANNINIKGAIKGKGHIASIGTEGSQNGNINFEAVGSGVEAGEENYVSIWSNNNININSISAYKSKDATSNTITEAIFKGILYSKNNINITNEENIDFKVNGSIICGKNMTISSNSENENKGIVNFTVTSDPALSSIVLSKFVDGWKNNIESRNIDQKETKEYSPTLPKVRFKAFNRI